MAPGFRRLHVVACEGGSRRRTFARVARHAGASACWSWAAQTRQGMPKVAVARDDSFERGISLARLGCAGELLIHEVAE